jgi:membrane protein DedA with SNARE-associated domain
VRHPLPHLPGVLHALEPALSHYGYLAVAGLVLLEDFGVPVPGETVLILGAVYAGTGRLSVWVVGVLAFLAAVAGDNIGFAIGHFGGRALVDRYGRYILLTRERVDRATAFFDRHGGKVIAVARFVEGLRQANGIIAGLTGMRWRRFLAFNALGAALWVGVWTCVGYFSGNNIDAIYRAATRYEAYFAAVIGAAILAFVAHRVWRWRRQRGAAGTARAAAGERSSRDAGHGPAGTRAEAETDAEACEDRQAQEAQAQQAQAQEAQAQEAPERPGSG